MKLEPKLHYLGNGDIIATDRLKEHSFVAYYVTDLGAFDFDRIAFGHGITREDAIFDLNQRKRKS
jgi:hypothetical protein